MSSVFFVLSTGLLKFASSPPTFFNGADIGTVDGLRGVLATRNLQVGVTLLEFSPNDTFDGDVCLDNPRSFTHGFIRENVIRLREAGTLDILCLMELRFGQNSLPSPFSDYARSLPSASELPLLWKRAEPLWDPFERLVRLAQSSLRKLYDETAAALQDTSPNFTNEFRQRDLIWAYSMFLSRAMPMPWKGRSLMMRDLDMLNHDPVPSAEIVHPSAEAARRGEISRLMVRRPLRVGDPITLSYVSDVAVQVATQAMFQFGFFDATLAPSTLLDVRSDMPQVPDAGVTPMKIFAASDLEELLREAVAAGIAPNFEAASKRLQTSAEDQLARVPAKARRRMRALANLERRALTSLLGKLRERETLRGKHDDL